MPFIVTAFPLQTIVSKTVVISESSVILTVTKESQPKLLTKVSIPVGLAALYVVPL